MSILVTGGAGFIGSHTCVELLNAGYDVIVLDNYYNSQPESLKRIKKITGKDFKFYEADIRHRDELDKIFSKSLHELVNEGLHNKLYRMPGNARIKFI